MDLSLYRKKVGPDGAFGELRDPVGALLAVTLERTYLDSSEYSPKIPPGDYVCIRGLHRLKDDQKSFETFEIADVPGHFDVLFHRGNWATDSEGCVLLGCERGVLNMRPAIMRSREAFDRFMRLQEGLSSFALSVI